MNLKRTLTAVLLGAVALPFCGAGSVHAQGSLSGFSFSANDGFMSGVSGTIDAPNLTPGEAATGSGLIIINPGNTSTGVGIYHAFTVTTFKGETSYLNNYDQSIILLGSVGVVVTSGSTTGDLFVACGLSRQVLDFGITLDGAAPTIANGDELDVLALNPSPATGFLNC